MLFISFDSKVSVGSKNVGLSIGIKFETEEQNGFVLLTNLIPFLTQIQAIPAKIPRVKKLPQYVFYISLSSICSSVFIVGATSSCSFRYLLNLFRHFLFFFYILFNYQYVILYVMRFDFIYFDNFNIIITFLIHDFNLNSFMFFSLKVLNIFY